MSIRDLIAEAIHDKTLFAMEPEIASAPVARQLIMSPEVHDLLYGPWPGREAAVRLSRLRADMEDFVSGGFVSVSLTPYRAKKWALLA